MVQLPDELLQLVCEHFRPSDDLRKRTQDDAKRKTLRCISQADRAFRRTAQPILMHTLDFRKRDWSVLRATLQLILDQPHLAAFVRKVLTLCWTYDEDLGCPSGQELRSCLTAANKLHLRRECLKALKYQLKYGFKHGYEDPELALLLCLCTRLESMDLECPGEVNETLVMKVLVDSVSKPAPGTAQLPFRRIRDVQLRHGSAAPTTAVSDIVPLFYLPALCSLSAEFLDNRERDFAFHDVESHIREIHLHGPGIDAVGLEEMIVVCPRLTSLALDWGNRDTCFHLEISAFGDVLREHATNLKQLHIIFGRRGHFKPKDATLGPLKSLTQLVRLAAPFCVLFDHKKSHQEQHQLENILPPSLQSLTVPADTSGDKVWERAACLAGQLKGLMQDSRFELLTSLEFDHTTCQVMTREFGVRDSVRDDRGWLRIGPLHQSGEPTRWKLLKI